ncbi:hypothetical protein ACFL7D_09690 [candidate division KSB1 bacterium]
MNTIEAVLITGTLFTLLIIQQKIMNGRKRTVKIDSDKEVKRSILHLRNRKRHTGE